jgi:hypothetical protein
MDSRDLATSTRSQRFTADSPHSDVETDQIHTIEVDGDDNDYVLCHSTCSLRDGGERSKYCHGCAQLRVMELEQDLAEAQAQLARLRAQAERILAEWDDYDSDRVDDVSGLDERIGVELREMLRHVPG